MNTVVRTTILVQYLLFRKVFHCLSIIISFTIGFLFILMAILYNHSVTLQKIVLRWRVLVN